VGLRDQWYKNAIIYCLDVETYADSDGDEVGDFNGLTRRLLSARPPAPLLAPYVEVR
jgi:hypothetical protein